MGRHSRWAALLAQLCRCGVVTGNWHLWEHNRPQENCQPQPGGRSEDWPQPAGWRREINQSQADCTQHGISISACFAESRALTFLLPNSLSAWTAEGKPGPKGAQAVLSTGSMRHSADTLGSRPAASTLTLAPCTQPTSLRDVLVSHSLHSVACHPQLFPSQGCNLASSAWCPRALPLQCMAPCHVRHCLLIACTSMALSK